MTITLRLGSIGVGVGIVLAASASHAEAGDEGQELAAAKRSKGVSRAERPDVEPKPSFDNAPLDVKKQTQEYGVWASAIRSRSTSANPWSNGVDVMLTSGLAPRVPWFRVSGFLGVVVRAFDSKSYSITPYYQGLEGGLGIGVFELAASVGVSVLSVDVAHAKWSFGFFQPRTSALAGLRFRNLHLRGVIYSEYYWRWLKRDSLLVQGMGIQLLVGSPNVGAESNGQ